MYNPQSLAHYTTQVNKPHWPYSRKEWHWGNIILKFGVSKILLEKSPKGRETGHQATLFFNKAEEFNTTVWCTQCNAYQFLNLGSQGPDSVVPKKTQ